MEKILSNTGLIGMIAKEMGIDAEFIRVTDK
jgi:hypothetical protein